MNNKRITGQTVLPALTRQAKRRFSTGLAILMVGAFLGSLVACAPEEPEPETRVEPRDETVRVAYVPWSSEIASSNVLRAVLQEELGYRVELVRREPEEMWVAVAEGEVDLSVSAWLPLTHGEYYERYGDQVVDLGPHLEGARTGLVIPRVSVGRQTGESGRRVRPYIPLSSIAELAEYAERFDNRIMGIDPEAGVMARAREALEVYGLDDAFRLVEADETRMVGALENAVRRQEWIVVTGWTPHWAFSRWDLAFLDDPENVFGDTEAIHTIVRDGLSEDMPELYAVLERFAWSVRDMSRVMLWIEDADGVDPYGAARRWVRNNRATVDAWIGE